MPLDFEAAEATLNEIFAEVQELIFHNQQPPAQKEIIEASDIIFNTAIQSYREALIGIALVRFQDRRANLRLPYVNQGERAYNGRDLDEQVVNPFLQKHRIPSSRGPYLAMFRRDFRFDRSRRQGQRNKACFDAFLDLIAALEVMDDDAQIRDFIAYQLYSFAKLREAADVPLSRLQRISLEQFENLISRLLATPSGGRLPVIIVVAALRTIKDYFRLDWTIDFQGINAADAAAGVGGDITVMLGATIVFAAEITERPVERTRVIATFNTKIAPHQIQDYLFFVRPDGLTEEARRQAEQYFAQGHEVNFLEIQDWVKMALATMGRKGRDAFNEHLINLIDAVDVPRAIKVAWNEYIAAIAEG